MYGAVILICANLLVKLIGAGFKIPLTYLLGEEGMGIFTISYTIYTWLFVLATAGFPVAISKMVAESTALDKKRETGKILTVSLTVLGIIGILGTAVLYFFSDTFSNAATGSSIATYSIRAIAPAVFFVSVMSAFRGFFQGRQEMMPTAASEVIEALGKLLIGFGLAYMLIGKGISYGAAGAVFGVSVGAGLAMVLLIGIFAVKKPLKGLKDEKSETTPTGKILKRLLIIVLPITIGASVFSLTSLIDAMMINKRLIAAGFEASAMSLWGSYSGYAIPIFNMPPTLVTAISISIVPAIAAAYAQKNTMEAQKITNSALKITTLFALPCAVGISILSNPILKLIYNNTNATTTLAILGVAVLFVSLVLVTNAVLQAIGKVWVPVINMAIGGVLKVIVNYFMVGTPSINIAGAPIGTNCCYILILVLNLISIAKIMNIKYDISSLLVKPLLAVAAMAVAVLGAYNIFAESGRILAAAVPIACGALVYVVMIIFTKALSDDEILMLPKGEKLLKLLKRG